MAKEIERIDIGSVPELMHIVQRVRETGEPCILRRDSEDLAILAPVGTGLKKRPRVLRGKPISADDPLWKMVGIGDSGGPGDVSENKHKYLAEAYLHETKET